MSGVRFIANRGVEYAIFHIEEDDVVYCMVGARVAKALGRQEEYVWTTVPLERKESGSTQEAAEANQGADDPADS